jgi:hypothetical protein
MKERSVPIRPGIEDHLVRGALSLSEFGIYTLIHIQADYRTGIWRGSAPRILATAPRGASLRKIQRALEHLEELGYLKSFRPQGVRGNTPYLIDKFTVRSGALKWRRLNAAQSASWRDPCYDLVAEDDAQTVADSAAEHDALSRRKKKEETGKKENPAAKPPSPAATGYQAVLDSIWKAFEKKNGQAPAWGTKDYAALSRFLKRNSHPPEEIIQRFRHYLESTEDFTAKQGFSLTFFFSRFDTFMRGPIFDRRNNGQGNTSARSGTPTVGDKHRATLEAFRSTQPKPVN